MAIPLRLKAPAATWERDVDIVVLGSGVAGLSAALAAGPERSVLVVTKDVLEADSAQWAHAGLTAVLESADPTETHVQDTLGAGAGLCDEQVVRELVGQAPASVRHLIRLDLDLESALTRRGVDVMVHTFALNLVMGSTPDGARQIAGVRVARTDENGAVESVGTITARAVVIACGGNGQVFASTSNTLAVTGDGMAMALRAGLAVRDLEFVEFHPTVMWRGPEARGQPTLVPEAVRSEGAILVDAAGERIMAGVHPREDLAPRDVVAEAISARMAEAPAGIDDHVYLDATHIGERFAERFPTIFASCREVGLDPAVDRIPVAPAAHHSCGGIPAGLDGTTDLVGLFAVGEVASTGVHGADRLVSNSLVEAIVAGTAVGRNLAQELPGRARIEPDHLDPLGHELLDPVRLREVRAAMSRHVGVIRDESRLAMALGALGSLARSASSGVDAHRSSWEATNLLTVASAIVSAALARTESRGCHRRSDHPDTDPAWTHHLEVVLDAVGSIDIGPESDLSRCR